MKAGTDDDDDDEAARRIERVTLTDLEWVGVKRFEGKKQVRIDVENSSWLLIKR